MSQPISVQDIRFIRIHEYDIITQPNNKNNKNNK